MAADRSPTIDLTYNIRGTALEQLRNIQDAVDAINISASQGINFGRSRTNTTTPMPTTTATPGAAAGGPMSETTALRVAVRHQTTATKELTTAIQQLTNTFRGGGRGGQGGGNNTNNWVSTLFQQFNQANQGGRQPRDPNEIAAERISRQFKQHRIKREMAKLDRILGFDKEKEKDDQDGTGSDSFGRQRLVYGLMNPMSTFGGSRLLAHMGTPGLVAAGAMGVSNTAGALAGAATPMINAGMNTDRTASQRFQDITEGLPIVGDTLKKFREFGNAMSGVTEMMRQNVRDAEIRTARIAGRGAADSQIQQLEAAHAQAGNRARALATARPLQVTGQDHTTFAGQMATEQAQRRLPLAQNLEIAQAEHRGALANVGSAKSQVESIEKNIASTQAEIAGRQRRIDQLAGAENGTNVNQGVFSAIAGMASGNGAQVASGVAGAASASSLAAAREERRNLLALQSSSNETLTNQSNQLISAQQRLQQAYTAAGQAGIEARRANIAILQDEMQNLRQREQLTANSAQNLAAMNPAQRAMGMHAWRTARAHVEGGGNIADLPQFVQEQAATVAGNQVNRWREQGGERLAEQDELREGGALGNAAPGENLTQLREAMDRLGNRLNLEQLAVKQDEANVQFRALDVTLKKLIDTLNAIASIRPRQVQIGQAVAQATS